MAKTPQQMVANWQAGMQQGGQKWLAGINALGINPLTQAIAAKSKMIQNWNNVMNGTAWDEAMGSISLQQWKQACQGALQKFQMGAAKGQAKYQKFANAAQPVYAAMRAAADSASGPIAKVSAALQVLLQAGKKQGGNAFV